MISHWSEIKWLGELNIPFCFSFLHSLVVGSWQKNKLKRNIEWEKYKFKFKWCVYYGSNLFDIIHIYGLWWFGALVVWSEHKFWFGFIRIYIWVSLGNVRSMQCSTTSKHPSIHLQWTMHPGFDVCIILYANYNICSFVRQTSITKIGIQFISKQNAQHKRELNGNHERRKIESSHFHRWSLDVTRLILNKLNRIKTSNEHIQTKEYRIEFEGINYSRIIKFKPKLIGIRRKTLRTKLYGTNPLLT